MAPIPYKMEERLLSIEGLNLSYGDKIVLRDINVHVDNVTRDDVHQGQCIALLGPSGIGKTQLFRCIAGMQAPTSGKVMLTPEKRPVVTGEVGVVQQSYPLLAHRTIRGNLELVCADVKRVMELLHRFGLDDQSDKYPVQLSGGQRQRVAIIQQMLSSRHFLLMDEPFSGLDVIAKDKVCALINEVNLVDELNTTIFTTHDLESSMMIADTIWILGREEGKPGATIVRQYDLMAMGIAWQPNIEKHPSFIPLLMELRELFKTL
ncbi:ATP-binding cassette domain-containing protein [Acinetobacter sp.]|uniref:ATP-binding cassette domain-containing protein n=1 Tax=Acinetobacter sp. TaxID=472 RepID=UPI00388FD015